MIPRRLLIAIAIASICLLGFFGARAWVAAPKNSDYKNNLTLGSQSPPKNIRYDSGIPRFFDWFPKKQKIAVPVKIQKLQKPVPEPPKMAIVLDDWGKNKALLRMERQGDFFVVTLKAQ